MGTTGLLKIPPKKQKQKQKQKNNKKQLFGCHSNGLHHNSSIKIQMLYKCCGFLADDLRLLCVCLLAAAFRKTKLGRKAILIHVN